MDCQEELVDDNNTAEDDNNTVEADNAEDCALTVEEGEEHQENIQRINTVEQSPMKDIQEEESIEELIQVNEIYQSYFGWGIQIHKSLFADK